MAAAQIDGTTADNIVVGSGPGFESLVQVYGTALPPSGAAPKVFANFSPYPGQTSGVSLTTGFVDFSTGRYSIVTAPGPGDDAVVKVFAFPLLKPIPGSKPSEPDGSSHGNGADQPQMSAQFTPFGPGYKGGVSLATGWLAGHLGGAERIVVGQLAGDGRVKVFSSGSALDGGPGIYLQSPRDHGRGVSFREIASLAPFGRSGGVHVAATSTTTGAHLLVGGSSGPSGEAQVLRFDFTRSETDRTMLDAKPMGTAISLARSSAAILAGD